RMLNQIGESNEGILAGGIRTLTNLVENYEKVIDALKVLAITYGAYRAALVATTIAKNGLTIAESLHYFWLVAVEKAQKLLNATILKNPYALAAAALAAIVSALVLMAKKANEATLAQEALARINDEVARSMDEQRAKIELLRNTAQDERLTNEQRLNAIKKLKELMPGYNAEISKEGRLINENTEAIKAYLKQLEIKIKQQAAEKELAALYEKEREAIKELTKAQEAFNRVKNSTRVKSANDIKYGGGSQMAYASANAKVELENAKKNLEAVRNAIAEVNNEIVSGQVGLSGLLQQSAQGAQSSIRTIKDLEDELSELERRYKEATDIKDTSGLESLKNLIIRKRKELERYSVEVAKANAVDAGESKFKELLDETQTYQQKRIALEFQFQQKLAALKSDPRATGENIEVLRKQHQLELDELDREYGITVEKYKFLYGSIEHLSIQMLKERIAKIKETLGQSGLSEQLQADALRALQAAEEALLSRAPLAALASINQRIAELRAQVDKAESQADAEALYDELAKAEADKAKALQNLLGNVASRLSEARDIAAYLNEELALAVDLASNLASAFANIAAGNYIQGGLQLATSIIQLQKYFEDKKQRKAEEAEQRRVEASNRLIAEANSLLSQQLELLDRIRGTNVYAGLTSSQQALNAALKDYIEATEKLNLYNRNDSYYKWESSWFNGALFKYEKVKR
ncbi:MAG: hypothetical protein H5T24_08895, partial [Bacteroidales bacterium]|nr:hypothetical protein [Bacteroidales bacterium]